MAKVDLRKLSTKEHQRLLDVLVESLGNVREQRRLSEFLRLFLTPAERVMLGRRLLISRALLAGKTYTEIREELGVGLTTVAFVDRWLRVVVETYLYADERKRKSMQRQRYAQALRKKIAVEARSSSRPAGVFWLFHALGMR